MGEKNEAENVEPIKQVESIHLTGRQRDTFLQLCDAVPTPDRSKGRLYHRAFLWAAQGEWASWDEWRDAKKNINVVPAHLLDETTILDADKKQSRAIVQLIDDAIEKGGLLGATIRKLDTRPGESLVSFWKRTRADLLAALEALPPMLQVARVFGE